LGHTVTEVKNCPSDVPQFFDKGQGEYTMINTSRKSKITQREMLNSVTDYLHFDKHTTRIIGSGSRCSSVDIGELISC